MNSDDIVIVSAARTPMGGFQGSLSAVKATELGSSAIKAAVQRAGIDGSDVNEVFMGCVLPAALGQAPARQAALGAGLPLSAGAMTVNKVCGSGLKTAMLGHDLLKAGSADVIIAGGMESMSNAPYVLPQARQGYRMGHAQMLDHMMFDGLEDAYDRKAMGCFAQSTADDYGFSREDMDNFAIRSLQRAQRAIESGSFNDEVEPVTYQTRKGEVTVEIDEQPGKANLEKIPQLRPAFAKDGTVTAANSSSISDGAAALVLMRAGDAKARGLKPLARIASHATFARKPSEFTMAPVGAMESALERAGWKKDDIDLWEINEAFAMVTMLAMKEMQLSEDQVNINGGACALGHPIGASGARILVTLLHALKQQDKKRGMASLCIGGGEAVAMTVELL